MTRMHQAQILKRSPVCLRLCLRLRLRLRLCLSVCVCLCLCLCVCVYSPQWHIIINVGTDFRDFIFADRHRRPSSSGRNGKRHEFWTVAFIMTLNSKKIYNRTLTFQIFFFSTRATLRRSNSRTRCNAWVPRASGPFKTLRSGYVFFSSFFGTPKGLERVDLASEPLRRGHVWEKHTLQNLFSMKCVL
jgi:hypothetical protein